MSGDLDARPWGHYRVLYREPGLQVKRIEIDAGKRFSLQRHRRRAERWVVLSGEGIATLGERQIPVQAGAFLEIPVGAVHRLQSGPGEPLVFIEIQTGPYLEEDDIERLEDDFRRA